MEPPHDPQIQALEGIQKQYQVVISVSYDEFLSGNEDFPAVEFSLKDKSFRLFVDDEYKDLRLNKPLLSLCVVLRTLEAYEIASDFLVWCQHNRFEPSDTHVRDYYRNLGNIYKEIEKILGKIDSQISDYDFGLNAGAAQRLRTFLI